MTWIAAAVIATASVYTAIESKKAQKRARKDAAKDRVQARKAEVFAETEGQGIGNLATISLEVDDELDDDEINQGKSTVSI